MKVPLTVEASLSDLLTLRRRALEHAAELAQAVVSGPRAEANEATAILEMIAGDLGVKASAEIIHCLTASTNAYSGRTTRNVLKVLRSVRAEVPDRALREYFSFLLHCLSNRARFDLVASIFEDRLAQCPKDELGGLMAFASEQLFKRGYSEAQRLRMLRLAYHAQVRMTQLDGPASDTGLLLILRALCRENEALRKLAGQALYSLRFQLPGILSKRTLERMREILGKDVSELTPARKSRAIWAKQRLIHAIGAGSGLRGMLAAEMLHAMVEDGSISGFGSRDLEKEFSPSWSIMGMTHGVVPAFNDVWPDLREGFLRGGDVGPMTCARIVVSYGPQARGKLREMVRLFKERHGDCGVSSPLLWTILQVGIGTDIPRKTLEWVRDTEGNCPHTNELEYLVRNRRPAPMPAYMRRVLRRMSKEKS